MGQKLYRLAVLLLLMGLIAAVGWFGWPWYAERAEHTSLDVVARRGHEVTSVEVIKLADREVKPGEAFYHVRHERADFPIVGRVTLTGAEAATLVKLWRQVRFSNGWSTLCHEPGFVLRFMVGSRCVFEVSVCFKCENICWEPTWFTSASLSMVPPKLDPASKMDDLKNYLMKL